MVLDMVLACSFCHARTSHAAVVRCSCFVVGVCVVVLFSGVPFVARALLGAMLWIAR